MVERFPNLPDGKYRIRAAAGNMYYRVVRDGSTVGAATVVGPLPFDVDIGDRIEIKDKTIKRLPK